MKSEPNISNKCCNINRLSIHMSKIRFIQAYCFFKYHCLNKFISRFFFLFKWLPLWKRWFLAMSLSLFLLRVEQIQRNLTHIKLPKQSCMMKCGLNKARDPLSWNDWYWLWRKIVWTIMDWSSLLVSFFLRLWQMQQEVRQMVTFCLVIPHNWWKHSILYATWQIPVLCHNGTSRKQVNTLNSSRDFASGTLYASQVAFNFSNSQQK